MQGEWHSELQSVQKVNPQEQSIEGVWANNKKIELHPGDGHTFKFEVFDL